MLACSASYAKPLKISGGGTIIVPDSWTTASKEGTPIPSESLTTEYGYGATCACEKPDSSGLPRTMMSAASLDLPKEMNYHNENMTIEQQITKEFKATLETQKIKNGYVTINGVKYFRTEEFNTMLGGRTCEYITYSGIINNKLYMFTFINTNINQGSKKDAFYHIMTTFRP